MKQLEKLTVEELITVYKAMEHNAPALFTFHNAEHGRGIVEALAKEKMKGGTDAERKLAAMLLGGSEATPAHGSTSPRTTVKTKLAVRKKASDSAILKDTVRKQSPR